MAESCSIVYIYHVIFIHLSVDGHLGCFHILAYVSIAAVNTGVCYLSKQLFPFSSHKHPGIELLDHIVLSLIF